MTTERFEEILALGENICVEFKRCSGKIEADVYETVCSFLNRLGGDIFLGVEDNGEVRGMAEGSVNPLVKNFIACVSNPALLSPTIYLEPHIIKYKGLSVIHIHINPSAEVHTYKKEIFDRVNDSDIHVTASSQIAQMYIRKQNIYTERKIYPYIKAEDLRTDMLPKIRTMAVNAGNGKHKWQSMTDEELMRSAGLVGTDHQTGEKGYNLAAVMLLGKDDVITDVLPAYLTDCLLRINNTDRYDDREIVRTNLIDSYDIITDFIRKNMQDEFFLEGDNRISIRGVIAREIVSNLLMHREFTSAYQAKLVIEKDKIYSENASRSSWIGNITPENLEPNPKNPIIASFFQNIGLADRLGSGVRNMFKYARQYRNGCPLFSEGDIFRTIISFPTDATDGNKMQPIDPTDATDGGKMQPMNPTDEGKIRPMSPTDEGKIRPMNPTDPTDNLIVFTMRENPKVSLTELAKICRKNRDTISRRIKSLSEKGLVWRVGNNKSGHWECADI